MKKLLLTILVLSASVCFAGDKTDNAQTAQDQFKAIHVSDLAQWMDQKDSNVVVIDANNEKTRSKEGVIPGARILSSFDKYNVAKELPADHNAKLVFYCANTMCSASHNAANRAIHKGYKDVSVMVDGIQGWKKAGKPFEPYKKSS